MRYTTIRLLCLLCCLGGVVTMHAQKRYSSYEAYIEKYYRLAQEHQERYKIPACITLAQGLLESGAGESELARKAHNHFGIKCHDWKGDKIRYKGSCYRKYKRVSDSYRDHSEFLLRDRYSSLFKLKITDYKGWARGLKRCGYATDPHYASKLINIIETYELMQYVKGVKSSGKSKREKESIESSSYEEPLPRAVYRCWGLLYVLAVEGDTYARIADDMGFAAKELAYYNDNRRDAILEEGEIVYLEPKNRKAQAGCEMHNVQEGETFYTISQRYGVDMKRLARRNHMRHNEALEAGTVLVLR